MQGGDIAAETPPRIIVGIDVIAQSTLVEERGKLARWKTEQKRYIESYNWAQLSAIWNKSFRYGLSVELAASRAEHWTQDHLLQVMERLDSRGGNPFNEATLYDSLEDFITELPYRVNLKGVIDLRGRVAFYGSWGIELDNLN